MKGIEDFNDTELSTINATLIERFGHPIELEQGDSEVRLQSSARELTQCPLVHWQHGDCNFFVLKSGDKRYRCQFYFRVHQQYGTGVDEFYDLAECMVTLLQTQADHERESNKESEA